MLGVNRIDFWEELNKHTRSGFRRGRYTHQSETLYMSDPIPVSMINDQKS